MALKKINSQSTVSKIVDSKFSIEVEEILGITFGSFEDVTWRKATILGQNTLQVSFTSIPILGSSTPKGSSSSTNDSNEVSSNAKWIERTLALRRLPDSKKSIAKKGLANKSSPYALSDMMSLKVNLCKDPNLVLPSWFLDFGFGKFFTKVTYYGYLDGSCDSPGAVWRDVEVHLSLCIKC